MNNEPSAHRPLDPEGEPPMAPGLGSDDIVVRHDDLSILVEAASPAEPRVAGTEDLRAMSERLRRVEEELDGVFQTIGRLLRGGDVSEPEGGARSAADAARLSEALDEHFERIQRVLHEGVEPGAEPRPEAK